MTLGGELEIQQNYSKLQSELQALAQKIGELESEAEEHEYVISPTNRHLLTLLLPLVWCSLPS